MILIPVLTVVLMLAFLAWILRREIKIIRFRKIVRPGHVVRIKVNGVSALAQVETRPGSDRIFYTILSPDAKSDQVSISQVYPI